MWRGRGRSRVEVDGGEAVCGNCSRIIPGYKKRLLSSVLVLITAGLGVTMMWRMLKVSSTFRLKSDMRSVDFR